VCFGQAAAGCSLTSKPGQPECRESRFLKISASGLRGGWDWAAFWAGDKHRSLSTETESGEQRGQVNSAPAVPTGKKPWDWPITLHAEISAKLGASGETSVNVQSDSIYGFT